MRDREADGQPKKEAYLDDLERIWPERHNKKCVKNARISFTIGPTFSSKCEVDTVRNSHPTEDAPGCSQSSSSTIYSQNKREACRSGRVKRW